jgi:hypothetical protein
MLISTTCLIVSILAAEPIAPTARTRYPYWQMVEEVVTQIESQPPRMQSINEGLRTPGQEYPFESFRHLRTGDLLRAAREGVAVARQQEALGKPAAEVDQQVLRNITIALEYLPLVIRENIDAADKEVRELDVLGFPKGDPLETDEILTIIENRDDDPLLRRFLLERSVPGFAADSLLARTLPQYLTARDKRLREVLIAVASHPAEVPSLQVLAMDIYLRYILDGYKEIFNSDPKMMELAAAGQPVEYIAAVDADALGLSTETLNGLKRMSSRLNDLVLAIAGHIGEGSTRDEQVKARTRTVLEEVRDTIYNVDRNAIAEYLDGKAPEPEPLWPGLPALDAAPTGLSMPDGTIAVPLPEDGGPPKF